MASSNDKKKIKMDLSRTVSAKLGRQRSEILGIYTGEAHARTVHPRQTTRGTSVDSSPGQILSPHQPLYNTSFKDYGGDSTEDTVSSPTPRDVSELTKLLQICRDLKKIDIDAAGQHYRMLMKDTNNHDALQSEQKWVQQREEFEEYLQNRNKEETAQKKCIEYERKLQQLQEELIKEKDISIQKINSLEDKLSSNHKKLAETEKEKEDLLHRLSQVFGKKLSDNNTAITDLSDPNRPLKIAEKFQILYDDQWTDALEALTSDFKRKEQEAICLLLDLLKNTYDFCKRKCKEQMEALLHNLINPTTAEKNDQVSDSFYSMDELIEVKKIRYRMGTKCLPQLIKAFVNELVGKELVGNNHTNAYITKCVEVTWTMVLHDPPLVFGKEPLEGEIFDVNYYRPYTVAGSQTAFVVFPPLLLHADGNLLAKGVVQAIKEETCRPKIQRASRFDTSAKDRQTSINRSRVDETKPYLLNESTNNEGRYLLSSIEHVPNHSTKGTSGSVKNTHTNNTSNFSTSVNYKQELVGSQSTIIDRKVKGFFNPPQAIFDEEAEWQKMHCYSSYYKMELSFYGREIKKGKWECFYRNEIYTVRDFINIFKLDPGRLYLSE